MRKRFLIGVMVTVSWTAEAADLQPVLQWVQSTGGSGSTTAAASAIDPQGNLCIVGSTTSADFPVRNAAQSMPGGSTLARIDIATGAGGRLFPAGLPALTAISASPAQPATLYGASANQIWKSTDAGLTWALLFAFPKTVTITATAADPSTPATLYAATDKLGVQKSIDSGKSWTGANSGLTTSSNGSVSASGIFVSPATPSLVFAATPYGLARSTDGGTTWTLVGGGNLFGPLAFDALLPGTVYLASGNSLFRSTDSGASFARISFLPNNASAIALAADPRHAGVLYEGTTVGLYRSADGGMTWNMSLTGFVTVVAVDPSTGAVFANSSNAILESTDGFITSKLFGPNQPSLTQLLVTGPNLFELSPVSADAYAVKLDPSGNLIYATYFGGSGSDSAVAAATGPDGSLYITGTTNSPDLPFATGAYAAKLPQSSNPQVSFVLKLDPRGALAWATYFPESGVTSIAVNANGEPYITGNTHGNLPTTPNAYQTSFQQTVSSNGFFSVPGPTSAFVTHFNSAGSALVYSTYIPVDNAKNVVQEGRGLAVDAAGNIWMGVAVNSTIASPGVPSPSVVELNASGSAVLASAVKAGLGNVAAVALDAVGNVYAAGASAPAAGGNSDVFAAEWDSSLSHLLAMTLLGGSGNDAATSISIDGSRGVIVSGYTESKDFPTRAPFQESFSSHSGFAAEFDSSLSKLMFSTYAGDTRTFDVHGAFPDGQGGVLLAGSTADTAFANRISLPAAPSVRLDSVRNPASQLAQALAPGEPIVAAGAGFATGASIVLDGTVLPSLSATSSSIVAVVPDNATTSGAHTVQIASAGLSNSVFVPAAPTSPGIYTADGSGLGQALVLNSDGSMNSPSNPAAVGSAITLYAAGTGLFTVLNGYAITPFEPAVFIDGFYCNGIAATEGPVSGLPGNVFRLSVYVPDPAVLAMNNPDLKTFKFPAQSSLQLRTGDGVSQPGVFVSIKQNP